MNRKIDFVTLSPLLFLIFLPIGAFLGPSFTQTAAHPEVAFLKYFSIPLIGFSLGSVIFLGIIRNDWRCPVPLAVFTERYTTHMILTASCIFLLCFSLLAILRYTTLHTSVLDMGSYDHKIWNISVASGASIFYKSAIGHFQPILIFYGLTYRIYDSPIIIQILQAAAIVSGVIPLVLLAKKHIKHNGLILLIILIYLFYSPVGFNATLDFHPDHLYLPLILWAFYFAENENYLKAIILITLSAMIKEPLILGASFFGLYLMAAKRQYKFGIIVFLSFLLLFLAVVYVILPYTNKQPTFSGRAFVFLGSSTEAGGIIARIKLFIDSLLIWKVRKLLFIYFLLVPLLLLPLFDWKRFLPALPLIAIPLLSVSYLSSSVDSQYTAGIIAPAFVALVFSLKRIKEGYTERYAIAFAIASAVMTLAFHIAHGASPVSINFWKSGWAEIWHKSNYTSGEHEGVIMRAIYKVSEVPNRMVISQGNINHARLAHRYGYWVFQFKWEDADYILLDLKRPLLIYDYVDKEAFMKELRRIKNNTKFQLEFEQDGVLLFKRK